MSDQDSCLIAKLSHYVKLDDGHRSLLAGIEKSEREFGAGEKIYSVGDRMKNLFVVRSGWLYSYTHLPDGGRHVVRIYHPGDIIGLSTLAFESHATNLRSANAGCLCPFEKADLDEIFVQAPRITALLFTLSSREQVILMDLLRAASRMKPRARLASLFLNILNRLRTTNSRMTNRMNMPLTQHDIGDTIGLTNVTVSRTLGEMEDDELIERPEGELVLKDEQALEKLCDYANRHDHLDTDWFPGV